MKTLKPQQIADFFHLYLVRKNGLWYGCTVAPLWTSSGWNIKDANNEMILLSRDILYTGKDKDNLFSPSVKTAEPKRLEERLKNWVAAECQRITKAEANVYNSGYLDCLNKLKDNFGLYETDDDKLLNSSLEILELSVRARNALHNGAMRELTKDGNYVYKEHKIKTVAQLIDTTAKELSQFRCLGKDTLTEIQKKLAKFGLCLKKD